jgi:alkylation response protein AidB-like acyl-CoA dehydrogenase
MDLRITEEQRLLQERARRFTDDHLIVHERACEAAGGLDGAALDAVKRAVVEQRFNAINHSVADGGRGFDLFAQILVSEQWGRATNALWDLVWRPAVPLRYATDAQKDEYLRPACAGSRRDAYAITEERAGSDPAMVTTSARRKHGGYVLSGEKWHVTAGDVADFILVHAHVDGDATKPTIFFVDKDRPGVEIVRTPKYMHTFVYEHPIFAFDDVFVGEDKILGEVGDGYDLTKEWFVEERLMIAARSVGAATRALEESLSFAAEREQFGEALTRFQGVGFMLADMAAEIAAAKALLYRVGWEAAFAGTEPKRLHALASTVKLFCSEMAGRVVDRAVQIHGGRGYMREYAVERLYRDLRVDRIWEGTSEVMRASILNELTKRGPDAFTDWI